MKSVLVKDVNIEKKYVGVYVHIPFYIAENESGENAAVFKNYISAVIKEIKSYKTKLQNHTVNTIFLGGGTEVIEKNDENIELGKPKNVEDKSTKPILDETLKTYNNALESVLNCINDTLVVQKNTEITLELSPKHITENSAKVWQKIGVNRISIVLNSTSKKILMLLGDTYSKKDYFNAVKILKNAGIKNISADILVGLPKQKIFTIKKTIKDATKQKIQHISIYEFVLTDHKNARKQVNNTNIKMPTDKKLVKMFNKSVKLLNKRNLKRYEISNFCLSGFECEHSENFWAMTEFVGFGAQAYSFLNNTRFGNCKNAEEYANKVNGNKNAKEYSEKITTKMLFEETVLLGIQTVKGINLENIEKEFNINLLKTKGEIIKEYISLNLLKLKNNNLSLKDKGFNVVNKIVADLIF